MAATDDRAGRTGATEGGKESLSRRDGCFSAQGRMLFPLCLMQVGAFSRKFPACAKEWSAPHDGAEEKRTRENGMLHLGTSAVMCAAMGSMLSTI